jgi:hypothetical protein
MHGPLNVKDKATEDLYNHFTYRNINVTPITLLSLSFVENAVYNWEWLVSFFFSSLMCPKCLLHCSPFYVFCFLTIDFKTS